MVLAYLSPDWFFGYDVLFEFLFFVVALIVGLFSLRIYRRTSNSYVKYFGIAFIIISISYLIQSAFNYLIFSQLNSEVCRMMSIYSISHFDTLGMLTHILFMTIGLSVLLFSVLKYRQLRVLWLIIAITLLGVFLSRDILNTFYLFSSIYLGFLSFHFIMNFLKNRKVDALLVAIAFLFLMFANFHFLVSVNHQLYYVIGHFLELLAYCLILFNLYRISR